MTASFVVEGFEIVNGRPHVVARRTSGIVFDLVEGARLGALPIIPPASQLAPRDGQRKGSYAFPLAEDADATVLQVGATAELTLPGPHCRRCGGNWATPHPIPRHVKADVAAAGDRLRAMELVKPYCSSVRTAKVVALHVARGRVDMSVTDNCHRCGSELGPGEEVVCPSCESFNYAWRE